MGLLLLFGAQTSGVLWLLLFAAVGLTLWEAKDLNLDRKTTAWWVLLVFVLAHVLGYLAMRVWGGVRKRSQA